MTVVPIRLVGKKRTRMKFKRLIKTFRKILMWQVKAELRYCSSLDGCIENATVDMIKAVYAAYHGLEGVGGIEESDIITDWACATFVQIQRGLAE